MTNSLTSFLEGFKKMFSKKKEKQNLDNSGNSNVRKTLGKISGAFMLPISIMAISGLWLGIGAAIVSNAGENQSLKTFGLFIQNLGEPVFAFLPLLFAISFVIAFTDEAGVAVFATVIGFATFLAIQSVFISDVNTQVKQVTKEFGEVKNYPVYLVDTLNASGTTTHEVLVNNGTAYEITNVPGNGVRIVPFKVDDSNITVTLQGDKPISFLLNNVGLTFKPKEVHGYKVLFGGGGRNPQTIERIVGTTIGIKSLQTSVFGGLAVGLLVQWTYNRFHTIQFPSIVSFFAGKRFVAIITVPFAALLAFVFLIFWPWVGYGLSVFGNALGKVPYGFESLIFGIVERSLVPFGLHHAFYSPLWYSDAGGSLNFSLGEWLQKNPDFVNEIKNNAQYKDLKTLIDTVAATPNKFVGDSTMSVNILQFNFNTVVFPVKENGVLKPSGETPIFDFMSQQLGIKAGRFLDGKFSFMILGLPAAAAAMIFAAPKENRKAAISAVVPSAVTTIVTGVTEPIEFTFLFLSPFLFWGFHAFFCGVSFMLANLLSVHIPQVFSGGFLDLIIYGMIPTPKGTHFYWIFVVGLFYIPLYFGFFYWWIKFKDLKTPGRGETVKLFTKEDYLKNKDAKKAASQVDPQALAIVEAFGGLDNITALNNCASRLRYDVKDSTLVNQDKLKQHGAVAIKIEGKNHVQAIFGPVAEQLNTKIRNSREAIAKLSMHQMEKLPSQPMHAKEATMVQTSMLETPVLVKSAAKGKVVPLSMVNDGVFSEKLIGDGYVVEFADEKFGSVYSPVDGTLSVVFETKHAYGLETAEGVQILIHIGVDTVSLNGQGFESFVKVGDKVKAGDLLAKVDLSLLKAKNLKNSVIVVVLNESPHQALTFKELDKEVSTEDVILEVR
ncbi:PTS system, glucose/glucosamine/beta-glucoside-specific, IICBA component [Mycoplasmopsis citelli]|uniref:PTS system, glucose/glucosamine/beta-glucoside-specific, IICBA component n=1 Tax=Mycoplasmopsis citelli TaxID=171281 RepID=A0A449B1I6_9BACT|nr:PTS transporter subunit IIABC [Mycoplasmopsis citelli]VEU74405.1 PTS system, glucose/glucosamine/beta-glucoside-specific, IICBA component [Mycoplasmopsis citelli]